MEKERLTIREEKITVEFEFRNESDSDITTEVAFPVPAYEALGTNCGVISDFADFKVWINAKELKYEIEDRAILRDVDYTDLLHAYGLQISTFANYFDPEGCGEPSKDYQVAHLSGERKAHLAQLGLIDKDNFPLWKVKRLYHWTQVFPAKKMVFVRHEYTPVEGYQFYSPQDLQPEALRQALREQDGFVGSPYLNACMEPSLINHLTKVARVGSSAESGGGLLVSTKWIDYILTSANTWKTPIKDFELIVERPVSKDSSKWFVSLCWDGPITRIDENHFSAKAQNFVPKRELTILFLANLPEPTPTH